MNAIILPYKNGSRSGAALANALGVRQIRLAGSTIHRQRPKNIINWGNSGRNLPPQGLGNHRIFNSPTSVGNATNKMTTFRSLYLADVRVPEYTEDYVRACDWLDDGFKVVERHTLTGHSGEGIIIVEGVDDLTAGCPLYVQYVKKQDEYRVHIMDGQVIDVQRKARRSDVPDEDVDWQVRNHQNGFCYMRENVSPDPDIIEQARNAIEALGLDFGAVDVIWNAHQSKAYVLEVNTACGLEGTTLERYKVAFQELLGTGEVTPLEGYDFSDEDAPLDEEDAFASDEEYLLSAESLSPPSPDPFRDAALPPTPRFVVGDTVRVVQAEYSPSHPQGTVGTVTHVLSHGCDVAVEGAMNLFYRHEWIERVQESPTPRELQAGDRVRIVPASQYYERSGSNPANVTGTISELRYWSDHPLKVTWDNGYTNCYRPEDLILWEETPTLTMDSLRVGMQLRSLRGNVHGATLGVGGVVTVTYVGVGTFRASLEGMYSDYPFESFNLQDFELIQEDDVQEGQGGIVELEYNERYRRHTDPRYSVGTCVIITNTGEAYTTLPWGQNTGRNPDRGTQGIIVGVAKHPHGMEVCAIEDSEGAIFVVGVQGVRRVDGGTTSVTQTSSGIPSQNPAPLNKWLVSVDGSVNLEEGVFDTQEEAEMALVSSDFHNLRQLGHEVRVVSL